MWETGPPCKAEFLNSILFFDDALQVYIEDLRDDFVENYVFWSVKVCTA